MHADANSSTATTRGPKPGKKYFTVDEANRSLTYVTRVIDDLTEAYAKVVELRRQLQASAADQRDHVELKYERSMDHLSELVDELQQVGVELKDFEKMLLDFPAIHEGREIYLCWRRGEAKVSAWHELDGAYAGRQDVALLDKKA